MKYKICTTCELKKTINKFHKDNSREDGIYPICKKCRVFYYNKNREKIIKHKKIYRENNIEKLKKYSAKYRKKNRAQCNEWSKAYYWKHIEEKRIYNNNYKKLRKQKDVGYKVLCNLRTRLWLALKGNPKLSTTLKLVSCSIRKLKLHLESKFKLGMTWGNYGKIWELDHIKPCCKFNLTKLKQQKQCFHYTNLRPLTISKNRQKAGK